MRTLPTEMIRVLSSFVPLFSRRVWPHVQVLLIGAILAPGKRTVSSALHAMGLSQEERFHRYHRVLSRASWSSREVSRVLLGLLVEMFVPEGDPLVVGIDETLERRYGRKISARGVSTVIQCVPPMRLLCEEQWAAVGVRDAVGGDPLGLSSLGLAFPQRPGPFRALCRQAGQATQEDNRVGMAATVADKALVSRT